MIAAHPFAALFDATRARARLEREARAHWGDSLEVTHCEVLHVWRKIHARAASAHKSFARVSYRLGLHDRSDGTFRQSLVHGLLSLDGREVRIDLRRFPEDPALPQLRPLANPAVVLRNAPAAVAAHCRTDTAARIDVVSYRPGERCTLRVTGAGSQAAFAKTFCNDAGAVLALRLQQLSRSAFAATPGLHWPELLAYDAANGTVWQAAVPDARPFVDGPPRRSLARGDWHALGGVLAALHATPLAGLGQFDRRQRLFESDKKLAKLENAGLASAPAARAAWLRCQSTLPQLAPMAPVLLHGDLHLGQLARSGNRIALFDYDELLLGPPEQDLASLRVSLESTGAARAAVERAFVAMLAGYCGGGGRAPDHASLDWHYRLQQIDRAYRDYWRYDAAAAGRIGCALRRAQRGLRGTGAGGDAA
jgi:hypothetical protein